MTRAIAALALAGAVLGMLLSTAPAQAAEPPDKPTGLEATETHGQVVLTWDDPGDDSITGYVILRRIRVNDTGGEFDVLVADTGTDATTYTDDTVAAGLTYTYRIKAINAAGASNRSRWYHIDTPAAPEAEAQAAEPPAKPRGLSATATHDSVTLTWDDPGDDSITGYVILRRVRVNNTGGDFSVLVSDTGTAALTYTDDTVAASLTYTYRIKAINEHGVSERSRWFHVDTPAAPEPEEEQAAEPPDQPTGLEATATHDSVTLTWDDPGGDSITGYVVLRRIPAVDPQGQFSELVSDTGTDATTYTDDTVSAETRYTYRIKAINEHGVSERSRWFHVDVPAAPQAAEGDEQDGDGDGGGARGGPGKKANVAEPSGDDLPGSTSTTGEVDVGGSVTGNIESGTDKDWFKVDLEMGKRYQIDLEGEDTGRGTLGNPFLTLYDASGSSLMVNDIDSGVGLNARLIYAPTANGTYYVQAADPGVDSNFGGATGTYTLSVIVLGANGASEADTDFPNNNTTTGRVEVGASVTGNVESAADYDWFAVDLEAGKRYQFDLEGAPNGRGTQPDPSLGLYDESGTPIIGNNDLTPTNVNSQILHTAIATGAHYLEARGALVDHTGTYTLSVRDITPADDSDTEEDDLAADTSTTGRVQVDGAAVRSIIRAPVFVEGTGGDVDGWDFDTDWFAVELEAGRTYRIDMTGATHVGADLTLRLPQINAIYGSNGGQLVNTFGRDESDSHYLFRVTFHAHASGTYYIAASGESFESGSYELRVKDVTAGPASKPAVAFEREPPGLAPNVPNPFNPGTVIPYRLDADGPVRLVIYNLLGQRIRTLVDEVQAAGAYRVRWEARDGRVAAGVYFIRLRYPGGVQTRRMLYLE